MANKQITIGFHCLCILCSAVYGEQVVSGVVCGGDITIHCVWRSDNLSSFNVASHQNWVIVIGNNLIGSAHDSQHWGAGEISQRTGKICCIPWPCFILSFKFTTTLSNSYVEVLLKWVTQFCGKHFLRIRKSVQNFNDGYSWQQPWCLINKIITRPIELSHWPRLICAQKLNWACAFNSFEKWSTKCQ